MSFYLDEGDEAVIPWVRVEAAQEEEQGSGAFVCENCGGCHAYLDETSGRLVCKDCFTQSQNTISASQEVIDYDETIALAGRVSGHLKSNHSGSNNRSRKRARVEDLDQTTRLPSVEDCILGMQHVLRESALHVARLLHCRNEDAVKASAACKEIWKAYLCSWIEGSNFYGRLYPEIRFCFRDAFLNAPLRRRMLKTLAHSASKKLRHESMNMRLCGSGQDGSNCVPKFVLSSDNALFQREFNSSRFAIDDFLFETASESTGRNSVIRMVYRHQQLAGKSTAGQNAVALSLSPSMTMVAAILRMAFAQFGITSSNIQSWIVEGRLPLLNAFNILPANQRKRLTDIRSFFRAREPPKVSLIEKYVAKLRVASGYDHRPFLLHKKSSSRNVPSQIRLAPDLSPEFVILRSLPLVLGRIVSELGLSQQVLNCSLSLIGLPFIWRKLRNDEISRLPAPQHEFRADRLNGLGSSALLGVVASVCKIIHEWENHWFGPSREYEKSEIPHGKDGSARIVVQGRGVRVSAGGIHPGLRTISYFQRSMLNVEAATMFREPSEFFMEEERRFSTGQILAPPPAILCDARIPMWGGNAAKRRACTTCEYYGEHNRCRHLISSPPSGPLVEFVSARIGRSPRQVDQYCHKVDGIE